MPVYEIDLSVRTNLTIEVKAKSADEAWAIGGDLMKRNDLDSPVEGRVRSHYIEEVDQVRMKPVERVEDLA